jgi:hypothetical protein
MAKCFRVVGQGVPVRTSDDDAHRVVVLEGDGEYCPKHVWKAERDSAYRVERGDNCLRKCVGARIVETDTLHRNMQHKRGRAA